MSKKAIRPIIDVESISDGKATICEVFGKVYAQIFREKLKEQSSTPLKTERKDPTLESS